MLSGGVCRAEPTAAWNGQPANDELEMGVSIDPISNGVSDALGMTQPQALGMTQPTESQPQQSQIDVDEQLKKAPSPQNCFTQCTRQ